MKPHTYCHDSNCLEWLHDWQIADKECDQLGMIEALCRKCIKEWLWLEQF